MDRRHLGQSSTLQELEVRPAGKIWQEDTVVKESSQVMWNKHRHISNLPITILSLMSCQKHGTAMICF